MCKLYRPTCGKVKICRYSTNLCIYRVSKKRGFVLKNFNFFLLRVHAFFLLSILKKSAKHKYFFSEIILKIFLLFCSNIFENNLLGNNRDMTKIRNNVSANLHCTYIFRRFFVKILLFIDRVL